MKQEPRVLIVENDDVLRVMLFTILRHQPVGVDTAANLDQAMVKVSKCDYALIVVDVDMPEQAGEAFVRWFREEHPEATTFILAVRDPKNDAALDAEFVNAVINKPLEIDTVAEIVRECSLIVPLPDDPQNCPPAESDIREQLERGPYITN